MSDCEYSCCTKAAATVPVVRGPVEKCDCCTAVHPESWNPSWSVATILVGLLSFMMEDGVAYGTIATSVSTLRRCHSVGMCSELS